jgi:hypothetical protein
MNFQSTAIEVMISMLLLFASRSAEQLRRMEVHEKCSTCRSHRIAYHWNDVRKFFRRSAGGHAVEKSDWLRIHRFVRVAGSAEHAGDTERRLG